MRYSMLNTYSIIFIIIGLTMLIFSGRDSVLAYSGLILTVAAYLYPLVTGLSARVWPISRVQAMGTGSLLKKPSGNPQSGEASPDKPIEVTDSSFDEVAQRYPFLVVDCWAPWCHPCSIISPIIEALAKSYAGRAVFAKLNVDENPKTAQRFDIMSIPTLLFVKDGKVVDRLIGAVPRPKIEEKLKSYL